MTRELFSLAIWWLALILSPIVVAGVLSDWSLLSWLLFPTLVILGLMWWPTKNLMVGLLLVAAWVDIYLFLPWGLTVGAVSLAILACRLSQARLSWRSLWTDSAIIFVSLGGYVLGLVAIWEINSRLNLVNIVADLRLGPLLFACALISFLLGSLVRRQGQQRLYIS